VEQKMVVGWRVGTLVSFTLKDETMQVAKTNVKLLSCTFIDTLTRPYVYSFKKTSKIRNLPFL
jgi:hypothetical protein